MNLLPRYFFLITNWSGSQRSGKELLAHYRRRGTFEDRLGEFNTAIGVHLSSRNFKENEATMLLSLLSFNLSSLCRIELEDSVGGCWDLTRFQLFVLKVGAEIIKHSRRLMMRIAQSAEPLWSRFVKRLEQWSLPSSHTIKLPRRSGFTAPPQHAHLNEVLRW
ncbi:MAG: transposase [Planctomycetaceae bacterium]